MTTLGVTVEEGVTIETGVTLVGGTGPAQYGDLQFNPLYNAGGALGFSNNDETVVDLGPGEYSTLTTYQLKPNIKVMVSYTLTYYTDPVSWIGLGTEVIYPYEGLGYDTTSIGIRSDGVVRYDNNEVATGFPNFTNQGDVIDFCIDTVNDVFYMRVNGGDWNNDPLANPATDTGGFFWGGATQFETGYPALAVGGYRAESSFTINQTATYAIPNGYTFIPDSFTIGPVTINGTAGGISVNGTVGFSSNGSHTCTFQYIYINVSNTGPNATLGDTIADYWIRNNLVADQTSYIFNANWGGSPGSDKVLIAFYNGSPSNRGLIISPVDTSTNLWQTPGLDPNSLQSASGTFNWPATFELYLPVIHDQANWC